jgi:hypothetical protein
MKKTRWFQLVNSYSSTHFTVGTLKRAFQCYDMEDIEMNKITFRWVFITKLMVWVPTCDDE